ncbi:hypothetical protein Ga0123461_1279 [Mariprofundus aestuarium]|uniref:Uncharacterized protein n=1 Tax=Mariprofundus aestuarium TaxID=1921086 RepID=A0A2K8KXN0_MARES|nr:hypothetical protein Ga0123461_1279 [Mariprofundus aestuarium]
MNEGCNKVPGSEPGLQTRGVINTNPLEINTFIFNDLEQPFTSRQ